MDFALLKITVPGPWRDILIAELADLGFDMMEETKNGLEASIEEDRKSEIDLEPLRERYSEISGLKFEWKYLEKINWNEEWEKNYAPVLVDTKCLIRADFHEMESNVPYEIIINPKMSFGTGHHATTWLMVSEMFNYTFNDKRVLDAGCGTGVLAILASKLGAKELVAYDISESCTENTLENAGINNVTVSVETCTIRDLKVKGEFDIILANINRNTLLEEMKDYVNKLKRGGQLFLSGFYLDDSISVRSSCEHLELKFASENEKDGWSVLVYGKN